jgi:magnesium transporter
MTPTAQLLLPEVEELIREGQYSDLRAALASLHPADVADILSAIEPRLAALGFRFMQRDDAAAAFAYLSPEVQEVLIRELGAEGTARVVEAMSTDDRARLVDELPEEVAQRVLNVLSPEERKATQAILGYPEGTVGRLMTSDFVAIRPHWTVGEALDHIRKHGRDAETIAYVYVIDNEGRLIDDMRLRSLLLADPNDTVEDHMNRSFVKLRATDDQEEAVRMMARYDRFALPVVDSRGALIGIVTSDDVADVAQQEATEDIQKLGGVAALHEPYMQTGHIQLFTKRGVWLGALFVGQTITILVLGSFQDRLEQAKVLVFFMPLVMSCGGNSGSQAATLVTRALALGEISPGDWWRIIRKEVLTSLMLGGSLAFMGWACVEFFTRVNVVTLDSSTHRGPLAATVAAAVFGVVLWGTTLGSILPLVLKRCGLDPAVASSPLVATLMDASGTLIYLGTSILVLTGVIL